MLCERCHREPATYHITYILDGQFTKANYCNQCQLALTAAESRFLASNPETIRCRYCDGPVCFDASEFPELPSATRLTELLCTACGEELRRFLEREIRDLRVGGLAG